MIYPQLRKPHVGALTMLLQSRSSAEKGNKLMLVLFTWLV